MPCRYRLFPWVTEPLGIAKVDHIGKQWNTTEEMGEESNTKKDVENVVLKGKELSYEEIVSLREHLNRLSAKEIKSIAKSLSIRLTGSSKKLI